jgi:hypothetical protein
MNGSINAIREVYECMAGVGGEGGQEQSGVYRLGLEGPERGPGDDAADDTHCHGGLSGGCVHRLGHVTGNPRESPADPLGGAPAPGAHH